MLVGAAIAVKIKTAPWFFLLPVVSHYILDTLPHEEYSINNIKQKKWNKSFFEFACIFSDITLGVAIIYIFSENFFLAILGGFFGALPDAFTFLDILLSNKWLKKHHNLHSKFHLCEDKKIPLFWEILCQLAVATLAILTLGGILKF